MKNSGYNIIKFNADLLVIDETNNNNNNSRRTNKLWSETQGDHQLNFFD
jgi:hypothetical protein